MRKGFLSILTLASLLLAPNLYAADTQNAQSWDTWVSRYTDSITDSEIADLRSKLPSAAQESFDSAGRGTQGLSVIIQRGLADANPHMTDSNYAAYMLANKAEVGYYMNQVKKRLTY